MTQERRRTVNFTEIRERLAGRCFVCELVAGNAEFRHHVVYEDETTIAFLNAYPVLYGSLLVAPRAHRERVTGHFTRDEYLALQEVVHRVGEAVCAVVPTERLYVLSLGSQQGNRHVHWHVVPLPPGVPFAQQQFAALDTDLCLDLSTDEFSDLALRVREALQHASWK